RSSHIYRTMMPWPAIILLMTLAGCVGNPVGSLFKSPIESANNYAVEHGLHPQTITTSRFALRSFQRRSTPEHRHKSLHVYIEGDGRAWLSRTRPSPDPTPHKAIGLQLAATDSHSDVLYLARPCQYLPKGELAGCAPKYWLSARFSEEVVKSTLEAVGTVMRRDGYERAFLVGYSGGGTVATLVASRLGPESVTGLITIGSVLDIDAWVGHFKLTPLTGSLSPLHVAEEPLRSIRQWHFMGEEDEIVPPGINRAFHTRLAQGERSAPSTRHVVADHDHTCCWTEGWADRLLAVRRR
ncbi:MAG: alpha/beta hydrolase, partial [Magnetococcales bacterium]|nr:alpha/beta hydrolase [Magnetococcales bacterium]